MNWRRIAVTGLVAGMVTITGCATNLPETNQGNRNGQRVADAVNHRADTYRTTNHRLGVTENGGTYRTNGIAERTTRGINRVANDLNLGRPHGRVGNTFRYGHHNGEAHTINNNVTRPATTNRAQRRYGMNFRGDYTHKQRYGNHTNEAQVMNNSATTSDQAIVSNHVTRGTGVRGRYANKNRFGNAIGIAPMVDQTIPVVNSEDNAITSNDMAFFRKNNGETPATPAPAVPTPAPVQSSSLSYDDTYDYDYNNNETMEDNYDDDNYDTTYETQPARTRLAK